MIVMLTRWADDVLGGTGGSSRGFRTWGSFPPCILRRVRVSPGLSARVPPGRLLSDLMLRLLASLSPFVALRFLPLPCVRFSPLRSSSLSRGVSPPFAFSASFPFLASSSLHVPIQLPPRISPPLSTRVSLRFLPVPSPSLRPVPVGLSTSFLTPLPGSFSSPFHAYLLGIVLCLGFCFPRCRFGYVFLSFLLRFLQLPSPSFPFLSSSSLQFSPLLSSSVLPSSSRPYGVPTLLPFPFLASGSRVLPPLFRGSVSVARGSRRSAPTPLQRSGKVSRERWDT